ncbi:MAG: glycosyl amidation-associated protein WbuZ [Candidatus Spechtbacteria bacterium]|nr:glycosyl amidation-associated protein WbuZ [Candidatus Spechtbacteria bacterium]
MLKTRVIPCLTIKDGRLVKSVKFREHRNIGSYISSVRVFNARDVDEMIFLDLDAYEKGMPVRLLEEVAKECFMPLTLGGGVKTCKDIERILKIGADKVAINTAALEKPRFIQEASRMFGNQCVVVSVDVQIKEGGYEVFGRGGTWATGRSPVEWVKEAEDLGAGEILLTSIDRDGTMEGYDTALVKSVSEAVNVPVIACGGAGTLDHFVEVMKDGGASAVACASIFQYTQVTPQNVKEYLLKAGIETRI